MNRRRFLKYAGATAAVAGASALGVDYLVTTKPSNQTIAPTTITVTPPTIENIKWTPTRVQNSKVYDGIVTFDLKNINQLAPDVKLDFQPLVPEQYPKAAFPVEDPRTYSLKPVSTATETKTFSFSQDITNLKGGKQYRAIASIVDSKEHELVGYTDTSYVREFENIAGKDNIQIGAHYLFFKGGGWGYWDENNGMPLLGNYDSGDSVVAARHIDWATGFGIDFLTLIWFGPSHYGTSMIKELLTNPMIKDVKYCIFYDSAQLSGPQLGPGPWNINNPAIRNKILNDLDYLIENGFLGHPSHLTIDGAHPIYYMNSIQWEGNVAALTDELRNRAKRSGVDLFIIGDPVGHYDPDPDPDRIRPFDAITTFLNISVNQSAINWNLEQTMQTNYAYWTSTARRVGVPFIPSAAPGYRKPIVPKFLVVPRSLQSFQKQLRIGKKYVDPNLKLFFITTFNDWTENTEIEPSVGEGFSYLQAIRDLAGH